MGTEGLRGVFMHRGRLRGRCLSATPHALLFIYFIFASRFSLLVHGGIQSFRFRIRDTGR